MSYREAIHSYYDDLNNLTDLLNKYVNIYRLLVASAAEANNTSSATREHIKEASERAAKMGDLIDEVIKVIEDSEDHYLKYCKTKSKVISSNTGKGDIYNEITKELDFDNSSISGKDM